MKPPCLSLFGRGARGEGLTNFNVTSVIKWIIKIN
jgi:hypothetical protein